MRLAALWDQGQSQVPRQEPGQLAGFPGVQLLSQDAEDDRDDVLRRPRKAIRKPGLHLLGELGQSVNFQRSARPPALEEESPHEHWQLGRKSKHALLGQPVAQHMQDGAQGLIGVLLSTWGQARLDEIADELDVSINTIKTHVRALYGKLGVTTRRDAVLVAHEQGLLG